jgi:hypothetical protein
LQIAEKDLGVPGSANDISADVADPADYGTVTIDKSISIVNDDVVETL